MEIRTIDLDLGKTSFHVVGFDGDGRVVLRRRLSRGQLAQFVAKLPACVVGMEACCGAHHLGRQMRAAGHEVRLIPPQFVRPFVAGQKNDYQDAEAKGDMFRRGRDLAAWVGLVPRQHSTGGRPTLLGISKRRNNYLRRILVHGKFNKVYLA